MRTLIVIATLLSCVLNPIFGSATDSKVAEAELSDNPAWDAYQVAYAEELQKYKSHIGELLWDTVFIESMQKIKSNSLKAHWKILMDFKNKNAFGIPPPNRKGDIDSAVMRENVQTKIDDLDIQFHRDLIDQIPIRVWELAPKFLRKEFELDLQSTVTANEIVHFLLSAKNYGGPKLPNLLKERKIREAHDYQINLLNQLFDVAQVAVDAGYIPEGSSQEDSSLLKAQKAVDIKFGKIIERRLKGFYRSHFGPRLVHPSIAKYLVGGGEDDSPEVDMLSRQEKILAAYYEESDYLLQDYGHRIQKLLQSTQSTGGDNMSSQLRELRDGMIDRHWSALENYQRAGAFDKLQPFHPQPERRMADLDLFFQRELLKNTPDQVWSHMPRWDRAEFNFDLQSTETANNIVNSLLSSRSERIDNELDYQTKELEQLKAAARSLINAGYRPEGMPVNARDSALVEKAIDIKFGDVFARRVKRIGGSKSLPELIPELSKYLT